MDGLCNSCPECPFQHSVQLDINGQVTDVPCLKTGATIVHETRVLVSANGHEETINCQEAGIPMSETPILLALRLPSSIFTGCAVATQAALALQPDHTHHVGEVLWKGKPNHKPVDYREAIFYWSGLVGDLRRPNTESNRFDRWWHTNEIENRLPTGLPDPKSIECLKLSRVRK